MRPPYTFAISPHIVRASLGNSRVSNDRTGELDGPKGDEEAQPRYDGCKVHVLERR